MHARTPLLQKRDAEVRARARALGLDLGERGGHPDIIAWSEGSASYYYLEYKGPTDDVKPKQNMYAQALAAMFPTALHYLAVKGAVTD